MLAWLLNILGEEVLSFFFCSRILVCFGEDGMFWWEVFVVVVSVWLFVWGVFSFFEGVL